VRKIPVQLTSLPRFGYRILKWSVKYYIFRQTSPIICSIHVTDVCNLRCEMCGVWKNESGETLDFELYKKTILDLSKSCCYLSLCGGEPLAIKDIFERIEFAKKYIPLVRIVTNGFIVNEQMAIKLGESKINEISISLDGFKDIHDKFRGREGSFDKAVAAIGYLKKHAPKANIVVSTIIAPWNIKQLPEFIDFVASLHVQHNFQAIGHIFEKVDNTAYLGSPFDENDLSALMNKIQSKKNVVNSKYYLSKIPEYFLKRNDFVAINEKRCLLPKYFIEIKPDKKLYICGIVFDEGKPFNLEMGLSNILKSKEFKAEQKNLETCKLCEKALYVCYLEPRVSFPFEKLIKYH
jgi:MoaA/NifB/PqqE/SkfB family radical SAM enzyme